jgi:hypothetical protein
MRTESPGLIRPQDCTLAFGVPTSLAELDRDISNPGGRDFVAKICKAAKVQDKIREYRLAVLDYIDTLLPAIEGTGAKVERGVTLHGLPDIFRDRSRKVITLFSHWDVRGFVEFADGLAPPAAIVEQVPVEYAGVLDLCVCHPIALAKELRLERPNIAFYKIYRSKRHGRFMALVLSGFVQKSGRAGATGI